MATRLKPSRINVDNTPHVGEGAAYQNDNDFHWSMGGGDMSYRDFEWNTLTGNSITIEDISNNITPSSDFTVTAGTLKPGIEYVLRVNTGNTPYTMTLGTGVTNPNGYSTTLQPNTVNQFKFIATSDSQLELEGVNAVIVASAAPSSPAEGTLWYDTTNDALKVYDGTNWNLVGKEYFPGVGIYFTDAIEYDKSAMRGPCPEGFHIPTDYESKELVEIILGFGFTLEEMTLPTAGSLSNYNGAHGGVGSSFSYWTCESDFDRYSPWNETHAYRISSDGVHSSLEYKADGCSIRPFRDNPIIPDSDWYPVYQSGEGGVYYNGTLGLISFSSDGTNWITIADKNLGATQMFVEGDEYTADNCGGFFQRGNNYMFPYSGATKTSSTTVEASGYGPGNYYSSDTFICGSGSAHNDRASDTGVATRDLRGYATGAVSKVVGSTINCTVTESPNVKAFYLASDQDLTTAQSALDWINAGNSAIIVYNDETYIDDSYTSIKSTKGDTKAVAAGSRTFKANRTYTEMINDHSIVYSNKITIHYTGNPGVVDEIIRGQSEETPEVLATDEEYPVPYTPLYDGSPATKKYVDDKSTYVGSSAPSNPTEGMLWYDTTNDVLKSYDGSAWTEVGNESADINTKTFGLENDSDMTAAQAIVDYYRAGKNPIIIYGDETYLFEGPIIITRGSAGIVFKGTIMRGGTNNAGGSSYGYERTITIYYESSDGSVQSISIGSSVEVPNMLLTGINYQNPYTPEYSGSPATKKYVDDKSTYIGNSAPSNPTEGQLWYDTTNDVLKSYNGSAWVEVGNESADINTKTFTISSNSDITNAQAAYDRYAAGKNPLVKYGGSTYTLETVNSSLMLFIKPNLTPGSDAAGSSPQNRLQGLNIMLSSGTVTSISTTLVAASGEKSFLAINTNYSTPYTPQYPGSPATKKYVDDGDTYIGSSAPTSNLVEGRLRYDTTNDQLKVYDGTNWHNVDTDTDTTYYAGKGISIGSIQSYAAMQGPCPAGYHVPLNSEWVSLCDILTSTFSLTSNRNTLETYLKLVPAGDLVYTDGSASNSGSLIAYRSATRYDNNYAYALRANYSGSINPSSPNSTKNAFAIRAFKDVPVIPDATWTELYADPNATGGTARPSGIYRNSTLGLISISGDGETWITIADKNLGATEVWVIGSTTTQANCGNFYQWGNCYGFPHSGATTTSSTTVDASTYGPGNFYTSSTFITSTSAYGGWETPSNYNLRGGTTGVISTNHGISNTGVLSVNGQTGDVTIPTAGESNTKTFYLSSTSDLTTAQAIYDRWVDGKTPIVVFNSGSAPSRVYLIDYAYPTVMRFKDVAISGGSSNQKSTLMQGAITINITSDVVTSVTYSNLDLGINYLKTGTYYSNPYTPEYDGSPATKKYVDDHAGTTYNAGPGISIGTYNDYSAMRGPCPEGFHVPTKTERNEVCKILTYTFGLTNNGDTIKTYLKMPFSGIRSENSSNVGSQGTIGRYWYCTPYSTSNAFYLLIDSTVITIQGTMERAEGLTIRSFKDEIVIPDSSWTTLYDGSSTATGAGVFHNATLGLISISGNGNTWYTLADKNVGATTVYNSGDTLSQANCGNYYQWGNNYGFPFTGSVTSSSTQVDASNYGPGNYYYSSTFITRNSSPYDWSSVQNDNLRGGVTGVITLQNAISNTEMGGIRLAPNSKYNVKYHRYGPETDYANLSQYYTDNPKDTAYFTTDE